MVDVTDNELPIDMDPPKKLTVARYLISNLPLRRKPPQDANSPLQVKDHFVKKLPRERHWIAVDKEFDYSITPDQWSVLKSRGFAKASRNWPRHRWSKHQ